MRTLPITIGQGFMRMRQLRMMAMMSPGMLMWSWVHSVLVMLLDWTTRRSRYVTLLLCSSLLAVTSTSFYSVSQMTALCMKGTSVSWIQASVPKDYRLPFSTSCADSMRTMSMIHMGILFFPQTGNTLLALGENQEK